MAHAIDEFLGDKGGLGLLHLLAGIGHGDLGHPGQQSADGFAIGPDGEVFLGEDEVEGKAVGVLEGALEDRLRNLKADEVVEGFGGIALLHTSRTSKPIGLQMRLGILVVEDDRSVAAAQSGYSEAVARLTAGWP